LRGHPVYNKINKNPGRMGLWERLTLDVEEHSMILEMLDFEDAFQLMNVLLTIGWHWTNQNTQ